MQPQKPHKLPKPPGLPRRGCETYNIDLDILKWKEDLEKNIKDIKKLLGKKFSDDDYSEIKKYNIKYGKSKKLKILLDKCNSLIFQIKDHEVDTLTGENKNPIHKESGFPCYAYGDIMKKNPFSPDVLMKYSNGRRPNSVLNAGSSINPLKPEEPSKKSTCGCFGKKPKTDLKSVARKAIW
jgi:hypothetical protein